MGDLIERVALALLKFENMGSKFEVPHGSDKWPVIMNERGKDYWRQKARVAIEAMRELPEEPGPRYTAGEYSRRTQAAMVDDALTV